MKSKQLPMRINNADLQGGENYNMVSMKQLQTKQFRI